jgi:hypothetical protein
MSNGHALPAIVDINLLPREHRPAQVSGLSLAVAAFLAICLLATIPLAFRAEAARGRAEAAQHIAEDAEVQLRGVESELARERALRAEIDTATTQAQVLHDKRAFLQGGARPLSEDLFWLYGLGFLPAGARITSVANSEAGFQVDGVATGPLDGIAYAAKLVENGGFVEARMTSFTPGDRTGGQFTVEVTR